MAAKILRYRQLGDVSIHLLMNIAVPVVDSLGP
jgi:hypothetical protein